MPECLSIIIPTLNGGDDFLLCLDGIKRQEYEGEIQLIVIDSGSTDGTIEAAEQAGAIIKKINKEDFSHSKTRNEAISLARCEKTVLMVQDAIPVSENLFSTMDNAIDEYGVAAGYGAHIPREDADLYARFEVETHREHLGKEPLIQQIKSEKLFKKEEYDVILRNVRLDNVCAIYRTELLKKYPFPDVSFAEDMAWAAKVMIHGHKILFHPDIVVSHSHNRSPEYRFRRAVANSIACMQIMGRVKYNVTHLNLPLYIKLSEKVHYLAKTIPDEFLKGTKMQERSDKSFRGIFYFFIRHLYAFLKKNKKLSRISLGPFQKLGVEAFGKLSEQHLKYVMSLISSKYPDSSPEDIRDCINQVAYTMMGNLLGEIYASYKLDGRSSPDLDEYVNSYIGGV